MTATSTQPVRGGRSLVAAAVALGLLAVLVRPSLAVPVAQAASRSPEAQRVSGTHWVGGGADVRVQQLGLPTHCPSCSQAACPGVGSQK